MSSFIPFFSFFAVRREWQARGIAILSALALMAACAAPAFGASRAVSPERVTLQLKWLHQFQFAGYYAAQAKGFYRDEGLEVAIREGGADRPVIAGVLAGETDFGIADSDLLIARMKGQPIVALAAIFQHSPYIIMSRQDSNIRTPSDLIGKTVMLSEDQGGVQFRAMLKREGIDPGLINIIAQSWNLGDLVTGKVDAVSAYTTAEPALMTARGVVPAMMRGVDYGIDFYGDILFTTEAKIAQNPERNAAFLRATRKGWDYAFSHEDELISLILEMNGVRQRGLTRETLRQEAKVMRSFVLPDVVEIGHMNPARFDTIARTLATLGVVQPGLSLAGFVYEPPRAVSPRLLRWLTGAGFAVFALLLLVLLWNMQIRRRVRERTRQLQAEVNHRTEVQQQLKVSQEMTQLMFGTAAAGIAMTTPDGRFLMANPAYHATVGYTQAELQAMDIRELTHPEDRSRYDEMTSRMVAGEVDTFSHEMRCLKRGGSVVWVRITVSMVRSADGMPTHIIVVTEDITQRRATEEKLRQSEVLLEIAGRTAQIGGWMLDLSGGPMMWSDEVCKIYEVPMSSKPLLHDVVQYCSPEWRENFTAAFERCSRDGVPCDEEFEIITANGRRVWIRAIAEALRNDSGEITRMQGACQDITERKQAEHSIVRLNAELENRVRRRTARLEAVNKELASVNRELETFSYSVSHDLRSPLNTIDGFSVLLQRTSGGLVGEKGQHYLSRIRAGTRQMGDLIEGLLSLAKLSRDPLQFGPVNLANIARQAVQECMDREPGREVNACIQDNLNVQGDPRLLSVVIQNLVGNAWKFTSKRVVAQIDIGSEIAVNGETVYFVKDNGAGFDMAYADKLFITFQRLHSPNDFAGSGIGLATVQRIIARHGGRVWAHAIEGQGADFYFTLDEGKAGSPLDTL
ncbi:ABC transporter substrate-binding protein [Polaromonas sp.]|uniref:ABC transporter substrate-binding protein n=1 Tax=Polaromonas sp. TaxID=1869339 RepID=UPI003BB4B070